MSAAEDKRERGARILRDVFGGDVRAAVSAHVSRGNSKVPHLILNFTSATDCPSHALGLCDVRRSAAERRSRGVSAFDCYALKREVQYMETVLPYRRRQDCLTSILSAEDIATAVLDIARRARHTVRALRLSEAGDFRGQADVDKAEHVARILRAAGLRTYCYTARRDLDYGECSALTVNGSGFVPRLRGGDGNTFVATSEPQSFPLVCRGDCRRCALCLTNGAKRIGVRLH